MYLDPGFGSMLVQGFVGLIAVTASSFYLFRKKVKDFFIKSKTKHKGVCLTGEQDGK
jgi:hypothetical protein